MDRLNLDKTNGFYKGSTFQKGYGIGDQFRRFFRWIVPKITPLAKKGLDSVKKELLNSASNIAKEVANGEDLKTSFIKITAIDSPSYENKEGRGLKRSSKVKFKPFTIFHNKKQKKNIFD